MGGLISRWALRDMENRGQAHQTRLFISYDSPHQGANAPLGYQYMYRHARSLYVRTGIAPLVEIIQLIRNRVSPYKALQISNQPAARQMLINWVNNNYALDNLMHDQWQTEIRSMGYPQQIVNGVPIRNVAVSNGSECAITQPYVPGATMLNFTGRANTRILSDILSFTSGLGPLAFTITAFATGQPAFLMGIMPGKNEIKFEFTVNSQPDRTNALLYRGLVSYKKTWFWLIPVQVTITNKTYNANPATLPFDYYPGGEINTGLDFQNSNSTNFFVKYNITASHIRTFSFVPVTSALDIGSGSITLTHGDYLTRYVGANPPLPPRNTPFQNFITAFNVNTTINNEQHIDILRRNGDWVANELNGIPPLANCSFICANSNITINGPDPLCNTQTYTLANPPAGGGITFTWTATPAGVVNIAPNGPQATLTKTGSGQISLRADITNNVCGTLTVTRSLRVGGFSSSDYPISGPSTSCPNRDVFFSTNNLPGATNYQWTWPSGWTYVSGQGTRNLALRTGSNSGALTVRVANACDAGGSPATKIVQILTSGCGFGFSASPNPSTGDFTIAAIQPPGVTATSTDQQKIYQIKVVDQVGNVKKQYNFLNGVTQTNINISNLAPGVYTLQAFNGIEWASKQVIKQ